MTFSLRQLACSRRLRALGVLAWLALVVNSLAAASPSMAGMPMAHATTAPMATAGTQADHVHAGAMAAAMPMDAGQADCCGGQAAHHGACAAICITALAPAAAPAFALVASTAAHAMPRRINPPSLLAAPPLRPPAA